MNFKKYIGENDKLKSLKSFIDLHKFKVLDRSYLSSWLASYGFENYEFVEPSGAIATSIVNLKEKFGKPLERANRSQDVYLYDWPIQFHDGVKVIINGRRPLGEDYEPPTFWDVYIEDNENVREIMGRLEAIINPQEVMVFEASDKLKAFKSFVDKDKIIEIVHPEQFGSEYYKHMISSLIPIKYMQKALREGFIMPHPRHPNISFYYGWALKFKDEAVIIIITQFFYNGNSFVYDQEKNVDKNWHIWSTLSEEEIKNRLEANQIPTRETFFRDEQPIQESKLEGFKNYMKTHKFKFLSFNEWLPVSRWLNISTGEYFLENVSYEDMFDRMQEIEVEPKTIKSQGDIDIEFEEGHAKADWYMQFADDTVVNIYGFVPHDYDEEEEAYAPEIMEDEPITWYIKVYPPKEYDSVKKKLKDIISL